MTDFLDISYLKNGNKKQQLAYSVITQYSMLEILKQHEPIVVGTIPIEIDIADSDLDIICNVSDFKLFRNLVHKHFGRFDLFHDKIGASHYVANFMIHELVIEIYAEDKPSTSQYAYLHMLVENRLLNLLGNSFKEKIINLKLQGYKTEPAFGRFLGLKDAYTELLSLIDFTDKQLLDFATILKIGDDII